MIFYASELDILRACDVFVFVIICLSPSMLKSGLGKASNDFDRVTFPDRNNIVRLFLFSCTA